LRPFAKFTTEDHVDLTIDTFNKSRGRRRTMNGGGHFRNWIWDPWLLVSQMIAMQAVYYASIACWLMIYDWLTGSPLSLEPIFNYGSMYIRELGGKTIFVAFILNALTSAVGLWFVVGRAKLCLDFTATVHFWHLVAVWIYNRSFPLTISWWLLNVICVTLTTVLGEYLCMRSEMRAIPVSLGPRAEV